MDTWRGKGRPGRYLVTTCNVAERSGEGCKEGCNACGKRVGYDHPVAYPINDRTGKPSSVGESYCGTRCLSRHMVVEK